MPEIDDSRETRQLAINFRTPEGAHYVYSDYVNANLGFFGFKLSFGTVDAIQPNPDVRDITMHVQIGLSAEHAKALHDLLGRQIEEYQEKFGALRELPKDEGNAQEE